MAPIMAGVLARRGVDAWVFRGDDGLDELTTTTTSQVWHVHDGIVTPTSLDPATLGIPAAKPEDLRGGDVTHNADVVRRVLDGETGAVRDAVLLNAAAALAVYERPEAPVEDALPAAYARATEAVDSGAAAALLTRWVAATAESPHGRDRRRRRRPVRRRSQQLQRGGPVLDAPSLLADQPLRER
jgi:anthranilate phosphoribosyltransferase